jgi:hypothetical protein
VETVLVQAYKDQYVRFFGSVSQIPQMPQPKTVASDPFLEISRNLSRTQKFGGCWSAGLIS